MGLVDGVPAVIACSREETRRHQASEGGIPMGGSMAGPVFSRERIARGGPKGLA